MTVSPINKDEEKTYKDGDIDRDFKREGYGYQGLGKVDGALKYFCNNNPLFDCGANIKCEGSGTVSCYQTILLDKSPNFNTKK